MTLAYSKSDSYGDGVADGEIANFFKGKNVFVTGATGFLGKILVQKLLRSCPDVGGIYVLVRDKKGKDVYSRIEEICNDPVFQRLNQEQPKFREKLYGIKGDVGKEGLGITSADRQLLADKISVMFHVAATVRFDEKLDVSVAINVRGTKEIIDLARSCPHLESVMHVSTAFSHCPQRKIEEKFYPTPHDPQKLMDIAFSTPDERIPAVTEKLLGTWPNTYAFTKAVAEEVVKLNGPGLPICVFRPAIVTACNEEPIHGWVDNINGPSGVLAGAGCGLLRAIQADANSKAELVPVDYVVNSMIAISYKTAKQRTPDIPIYNYVSSNQNPITWNEFKHLSVKHGSKVPSQKCVWYYSFHFFKYKYSYLVASFILHFLPAFFMDSGLFVWGKKPQFLKVYKKVNKFVDVLAFFTTREWEFWNDNVQNLWMEMSNADKKLFPFDITEINWDAYQKHHVLGIRRYVLKEDISTVPAALKKYKKLYILHRFLQGVFIAVALNLLYNLFLKVIL